MRWFFFCVTAVAFNDFWRAPLSLGSNLDRTVGFYDSLLNSDLNVDDTLTQPIVKHIFFHSGKIT